MSTKEQIEAEAMRSFKTVEAKVGSATVTLRELAHEERKALDASNYKAGPDGEFLEEAGFLVPLDPKHFLERWISATISPAFTVEEIEKWPLSLKRDLSEQARKVNNIEPAETTAKNS